MKKKAFVSFEFKADYDKKESLLAQSRQPDSPFSIEDISLQESAPDHLWLRKAQSAIVKCDIFIVILGNNTHQASGVIREAQIAKGLRKPRFQLKSQGTNPKAVQGVGPVFNWTWPRLKRALSQ